MRFLEEMFTPNVKAAQSEMGSRRAYSHLEGPAPAPPDTLGDEELAHIASRDGFYMATVSETGWPYVQFRGGPVGFLKRVDERRIGFADFRGSRQYISLGNLRGDDRVCLFLMDYPNRRRLKIIGRARAIEAGEHPEELERLRDPYPAKVERAILITVEAYDWNCPQHITPRFTEAEIAAAVQPLRDRLRELEAENADLRSRVFPGLV